ncbi:MAG TPA: HD domain-containing phosphohydrolase [Vicinamibacterales bacterium]|nr:HD domain-containing phosphohydrolase [Vicinamibacterales bacterium]
MAEPHARALTTRALQVYVVAVLAAGAFAIGDSVLGSIATPRPLEWLGLAAFAVVTGFFKVRVAAVSADIAVDDAFFIATALLFGPAPATVAIALSALVTRYRKQLRQLLFNTATFALSMWTSAHVFFLLARVRPLAIAHAPIAPFVLPLMAMAAVFFTINSLLIAIAIGLDTRRSPLLIWRQHFGWVAVGYFGSASIAFILILLMQEASAFAVLVVVLPLVAVLYFTLHLSLGRAEDAQRHLGELDRLYLSTVETLAMAIDAKDDVTHSHVRRVQAYAMALARTLGVEDELTLKAIEAAALLHDTGKLAIPEHILNKPGKLTVAEFEKMKLHADIGGDIISLVGFPYPVEPIVRCHHENWDGTGYPRGVVGDAIPIGARILSVVDCFDALTSDRPYRRALSDEAAVAILRERSGSMYDPHVVEAFVAMYPTVAIDQPETAEQREVLGRIRATRHTDPELSAPPLPTPAAMTHDLLAFVSLARLAGGEHTLLDVLGLASRLVAEIIPGITGAWYVPDEIEDRLTVADTFGPNAGLLAGRVVDTGDRLTGWVAARRQPILDSDVALDLGVAEPGTAAFKRCMSLPLVIGDAAIAVLTLYSSDDSIPADRASLVQVVAPHLAATVNAAIVRERRARAAATDRAGANRDLRLVSTR